MNTERESLVYLIRHYQEERMNLDAIGTLRVAFYNIVHSSASLWWNGDKGESYKLSVQLPGSKTETVHTSLEKAVDAFLGALKT